MTVELFLVWAQRDRLLAQELVKHLQGLVQEKLVRLVSESQIEPGAELQERLMEMIRRADLALFLISADFLASELLEGPVMAEALRRHERGDLRLIPVVLRTVDWQHLPLARLRPLPSNMLPVVKWRSRDEAWYDIVESIRAILVDKGPARDMALAGTWQGKSVLLPMTSEPEASCWNIPFRRNPLFIGRTEVCAHLTEILADGWPAAVCGMGGLGKTQLAVEFAYRQRSAYRHVLWMQAASYESLVASALELGGHLGFAPTSGENQNLWLGLVKRWLEAHSGWLLILDNAADLTLLEMVLPPGGGGDILITTRERSAGHLAQNVVLERLSDEEALQLLLRRAGLSALANLTEDEQGAAKKIVQIMEGLPLAIDQAGAYLEETGCSLTRYLELCREHLADLLKRRGRHHITHPESVAMTFSLAFTQVCRVDPLAADLLRLCASLATSAIPIRLFGSLPAGDERPLPAFFGQALLFEEAVATLRRFSLLERQMDREELELHAVVQVVLCDEMEEAELRHWMSYGLLALSWQLIDQKGRLTNVYDPDLLRHIFHLVWATEQWKPQPLEIVPLCYVSGSLLKEFASYDLAATILERGLVVCERELGELHPFTVQVLDRLGTVYKHWGEYERSREVYERAIWTSEQVFGRRSVETAEIQTSLAGLYRDLQDVERAAPLYKEALAVYNERQHDRSGDIEEEILLLTILNNVASFYVGQGQEDEAEPLLHAALKIMLSFHPEIDLYQAMIWNSLGCVYQGQDRVAEALEAYQKALEAEEKWGGKDSRGAALTLMNLASFYEELQKMAEAEECYLRSLAIYERHFDRPHLNLATATKRLASFYFHQERLGEAEPFFRKAYEISKAVLGAKHPETLQLLGSLAYLLRNLGRLEEAERLYKLGLILSEQVWSLGHEKPLSFLIGLLAMRYPQEQWEAKEVVADQEGEVDQEALKAFDLDKQEKMLLILEEVLGPERSESGIKLCGLGWDYFQQDNVLKAESLTRQALSTLEKIREPNLGAIVACYNNLATFASRQRKLGEAEELYKQALKILRKTPSLYKTQEMALILHGLGVTYMNTGKYKEAESYAWQALEVWEQLETPNAQYMADTLASLGILGILQGRYDDASLYLQESLALCQRELGPKHADTANSISWLGILYAQQGQQAQAEEYLRKAVEMYEHILGPSHPDTKEVREAYRRFLIYGRVR